MVPFLHAWGPPQVQEAATAAHGAKDFCGQVRRCNNRSQIFIETRKAKPAKNINIFLQVVVLPDGHPPHRRSQLPHPSASRTP